ncbi:AI-2E family transporter [halophilic archaeon]|nr:AI-2E family transporter [halophilic archaeon]
MSSSLTHNRERIAWWLIFGVFLVLFAFVLYSYIGTFVLGLFIYYATRPIYHQLSRHVHQRSLAAAVALSAISFPGLLLIAYTVLVSIQQLDAFLGPNLDRYQSLFGPYLEQISGSQNIQTSFQRFLSNPQRFTQILNPNTVSDTLVSAGGYLGAVLTGLLHVFIALIIAFYLLRDDQKLATWFTSRISGPDTATYAFLDEVDTDLETIYFGNILNAFVVAIVSAVTYTILNSIAPTEVAIPAAVLLGLLTGFASLIPIVGMKLIYVPVGLYLGGRALITNPQQIWFPIIFVLTAAAIVDGMTELLLRPYISGRNLHVGLVLFAYIIGPLLFGWYGLFFGPLLLVLLIHSTRIVLPELIHGQQLTSAATAGDPIPDSDPSSSSEDTESSEMSTTDAPETETTSESSESTKKRSDE